MQSALTFALFLFISGKTLAQENSIQQYSCKQSKNTITIDGKLDEKDWATASWTNNFVDIEGNKKPLPLQQTRCKLLWDNENLSLLTDKSKKEQTAKSRLFSKSCIFELPHLKTKTWAKIRR